MQTIFAGKPLIQLIMLAYRSNLPVMLHGKHGIGKSVLMAMAAKLLGIEFIVLDLSIMDPTDLIGIPHIGPDGRTTYAAPAFLPKPGTRGILMLEELNRSPRYMQNPCLQLLTARRLNDYRLPDGWLPCAAVNDVEDGYFAEELDPALLSRFVNVRVIPDVAEWVSWAQQAEIHPKVIDFVQSSPAVFDDWSANPRAWEYVNRAVVECERAGAPQEALAGLIAGLLKDAWALAFLRFYTDQRRPLKPAEIIDAYPAHKAALLGWVTKRHLDVVAASVDMLKRHIQPQRAYELVVANGSKKANVENFFADLPAELQQQVREWLDERGFRNLTVPVRSKGGKP
jgi:hypothetical protein